MNPLLLDIPDELTSDRLILRCPRPGDGPIVFPSVRDSLPELKPWMPWAVNDYSQECAEEWCRKSAADFLSRNQLQFLILSRADHRHLGSVGAFKFIWEIPACEIGYWLRTSETGRGLMLEAVMTLVEMLRRTLGMRRMEIRTDAENMRSRNVARRAGFHLEGILRKSKVNVGGAARDSCVFASINDGVIQTLSPSPTCGGRS
jgi:RimJ/RimL family protein N-acetyltransferase